MMMGRIRRLIFAWMLALVGSLLLPQVSFSATSGTTHDTQSTTTTMPVSSSEWTTIGKNQPAVLSVRSMANGWAWSLLGFPRNFKAPKNLTKSQQKAFNSYQERIAEHQKKLSDYRANPDAFDNQGLLKNAPNDQIRQKIIDGRIRHLEKEIKTFQENIDKLINSGSGG